MTQVRERPAAARHVLPAALLHDLRTPLNHVIGYSQLLMESAREGGQTALVPDIQTVLTAGGRLLALMNDNFYPAGTPAPAASIGARSKGLPADAEPPGAMLKAAEPAAAHEHGLLLVVDDDAANRDVLERRLKHQGYSVATAVNGRIALEMLRERDFDLVLLDIMMPEMDGFEVLKRIKADGALQDIPVIIISAMSETESAVRCIALGAEDFLPKPFDPTLLRARTVACLERKRAHDREVRFTVELQESYQRVLELERIRDDLTSMIVHDLRTPLTSVMSGLQTMEVVGELNETQREILDISLVSGQSLLGMINDLLDISKMESGALRLEREDVSVPALLISALKQVDFLATEKGLRVRTAVEPLLPSFSGDGEKLRRTLVNLLGNAVKFTPPEGTIEIAARLCDRERSILFAVSDDGEGIPPESFARIFEKFGQVETRTAGRNCSTGLGLTFCKLVVEAHGGHIWVESVMGEGSTFFFTIPQELQGRQKGR